MNDNGPPSPRMSPRTKIPILTNQSRSPRAIPITTPVAPETTATVKPRNTPKASMTLPDVPVLDTHAPHCAARSSPKIPVPPASSISPGKRRTEVEINNPASMVKNYHVLIAKSNLENELMNLGYTPLSKIVVNSNGEKRVQFIKAINKKGQKIFILVDVDGFAAAKANEVTLLEVNKTSIIPYSVKTGAYNCANKDVCGVAFECGSDAVCVLSREPTDLMPKESNFVFVDRKTDEAVETNVMTYPVVRLSEIRADPEIILKNTDIVIRRLRNNTYVTLLEELTVTRQAINKLNEAFLRFNSTRESNAAKLNATLTQLEKWNEIYIAHPPTTDENKDKYRKLQHNLVQRNDGIAILLQSMKKVADLTKEIDNVSNTINNVTEFCNKTFATVEYANSE